MMVRGAFRRFCHDHYFQSTQPGTLMKDMIEFEAPMGLLGKAAERLLLEGHVRRLLERRNRCIQLTADGNGWANYLV